MQRSTECRSILCFSVSWHCNTFAATTYDLRSAHTYVYSFCAILRDFTRIDIFRLFLLGCVTYIRYNLRSDAYYLCLVLFLLFLLLYFQILNYLYLVVLLARGHIKYARYLRTDDYICLVVPLARGRTKYVRYYLRADVLHMSDRTTCTRPYQLCPLLLTRQCTSYI